MWKAILAGTAAIAIAGTSLVYAQQQTDKAPQRWRPSQEDITAIANARIAALKGALQLTAEQEKKWPDFEAALRDIDKTRMERRAARQGQPRPADPMERMRRQADDLTTAGATLKRLADAQAPLYDSLDEGQKHRFQAMSRLLGPAHMRFADRGGREWRGGRPDRQAPRGAGTPL